MSLPTFQSLHGTTTQKTAIFIVSAVRTSGHISLFRYASWTRVLRHSGRWDNFGIKGQWNKSSWDSGWQKNSDYSMETCVRTDGQTCIRFRPLGAEIWTGAYGLRRQNRRLSLLHRQQDYISARPVHLCSFFAYLTTSTTNDKIILNHKL
jgi:hypothetical protein